MGCPALMGTTTAGGGGYCQAAFPSICNLLIYSDDSIKDIAYSCGFESLSYFNRVFLKKNTCLSKRLE
jgi:hypothetical protein